MSARAWLLGLKAETHVHVGMGQVYSAVDLPVIRETGTGFPFLPGSGMKGALRDRYEQSNGFHDNPRKEGAEKLVFAMFGSSGADGAEGAGSVVVSDARLLLLPVRSLERSFFFVTSPYLIERLLTDVKRAGGKEPNGASAMRQMQPKDNEALCVPSGAVQVGTAMVLEELALQPVEMPSPLTNLSELVSSLFGSASPLLASNQLLPRLAVISDAAMSYLAETTLPVRMRNHLDDETKTVASGQLWSEETVPPETVFTCLLAVRPHGDLEKVKEMVEGLKNGFIQVGGNETIGQGWLSVGKPDAVENGGPQ